MLKNQNFSLPIGDYALLLCSITDFDNGSKPLDLTGAQFTWEVQKGRYREQVILKDMASGDITILDATNGKATVKLTSEESNLLKVGEEYTHYLRLIDATGQVTTLATGKITPE